MINALQHTQNKFIIWPDAVFQFAGQDSAMQEDIGENRDMLTADMGDDWEDETCHIQEVAPRREITIKQRYRKRVKQDYK